MKRLMCVLPLVVVLCCAIDADAQSTGCPTGFAPVAAQTGDPADVNLDGYICESEPDVRPNGIVETMVLDNGTPACACPDAFVHALAAESPRADRNEDLFICRKVVIVGPPGETMVKRVYIDNVKCNQ